MEEEISLLRRKEEKTVGSIVIRQHQTPFTDQLDTFGSHDRQTDEYSVQRSGAEAESYFSSAKSTRRASVLRAQRPLRQIQHGSSSAQQRR